MAHQHPLVGAVMKLVALERDEQTGRVTGLGLIATDAADEIMLTRMNEAAHDGTFSRLALELSTGGTIEWIRTDPA